MFEKIRKMDLKEFALTALVFSIFSIIYFLFTSLKAFVMHEDKVIMELKNATFSPIDHVYIWLPVILFIIYCIIIYIVEHSKPIKVGVIRERPSEHHPMMIDYLMNKKFTKNGFTSTIMHLMNSGYLSLGKNSIGYYLIDKKGISNINHFFNPDEYLISSLFRQYARDEKLYFKTLKKKDFNNIFAYYCKLFRDSQYYEKLTLTDKITNIIYTFCLSGIIIFTIFHLFVNPIYVIVIITVYAIIFSYSIHLKWRNRRGRDLFRKWFSYKKYLKKKTYLEDKEMEEVEIWDEYLIDACALGINIKNVNDIFKDIHLENFDYVKALPKLHAFESDDEINNFI